MEILYAIIANGVVATVIVADETFIAENHPEAVRVDQLTPRPALGGATTGPRSRRQ